MEGSPMNVTDPSEKFLELSKQFHSSTVNQGMALNFVIGALGSFTKKGKQIETENINTILEGALRFSKVRQ